MRIRGVSERGAQAFLLATVIEQSLLAQSSNDSFRWLWVLPTDDDAVRASQDLKLALAVTPDLSEKTRATQVLHFPEWEHAPNKSVSPSVRVRLERTSVLNQSFQNQNQVIVSSLPACLQRVYSRAVYSTFRVLVNKGHDTVTREDLVAALLRFGYRRSETTEDAGTFSARGEIVDVFQPHSKYPVRIEFFDSQVETIRYFDPATQRSLEKPEAQPSSVFIFPAREFNIEHEFVADLRGSIRVWAEKNNIPRIERDLILDSVQPSVTPRYSEFWLPWTKMSTESAVAFFSPSCVYVSDTIGCQQSLDRWFENMASGTSPCPSAKDLYATCPDFQNAHLGQVNRYFDDLNILSQASDLTDTTTEDSRKERPDQINLSVKSMRDFVGSAEERLAIFKSKLPGWIESGYRVIITCSSDSRLARLSHLLEGKPVALVRGDVSAGFRTPDLALAVIRDTEILDAKAKEAKSKKPNSQTQNHEEATTWVELQALSDLCVLDLVVHQEHGIGRYLGLQKIDAAQATQEYLVVEYAQKDKLYLPVYRLNCVHRYAGASSTQALDRLGSQRFSAEKEHVKNAVKKVAFDLVSLYAERTVVSGIKLGEKDETFTLFEDAFPYEETPDQLKAIEAIYSDLESGRVTDRLICGDVGYGKTEVAIRAAYRLVAEGYQVAVLVPTTVLALQHEQSFKSRLKDFPVTIESVSRFKSKQEQKTVLEKLSGGKVDIIIGTHRLLSKDVAFKNLGLLVIDEEHRFGVEHKEKIKNLARNTHAVTMSATPIPRTLHMALSGIRDISLIHTAPVDRLPIRTFLAKYDEEILAQAIKNELARDGQIFFVHNRVDTIYEVARKLQELVPGLTVGVGHGQMAEGELEEVMLKFYERKIQLLLCTTIIESGLDVPNANTIIIDRADRFGLAQLYQLRGRVGRGQHRAYAYLLIPPESTLSDDAKRRLEVIQKFVELGSGFQIASHDLEIRGGGDLLGASQSGHIAAVGFDMYLELLEEAVKEARGTYEQTKVKEPELKVPMSAYISESFIPDIQSRLSFYRKLSSATDETSLEKLEAELEDRFGKVPEETHNLLWLLRIKIILKSHRLDALTVGPEKFTLSASAGHSLDPVKLIAKIQASRGAISLTPESKLVVVNKLSTMRDLFFKIEALLKEF